MIRNFKALILPVGGPGSGKTTWLEKRLNRRAIVNLDEFREKMTDDPQDQSADQSAVAARAIIVRERLSRGLLTAADATNARVDHRHPLLETARRFNVPVIAACFHVGIDECMRRMALRGRTMDRLIAEAILRDVTGASNVATLAVTTHLRIDIAENGAMAIRVSALGAALQDCQQLVEDAQALAINDDPWRFEALEVTFDEPAFQPADQPDRTASDTPA